MSYGGVSIRERRWLILEGALPLQGRQLLLRRQNVRTHPVGRGGGGGGGDLWVRYLTIHTVHQHTSLIIWMYVRTERTATGRRDAHPCPPTYPLTHQPQDQAVDATVEYTCTLPLNLSDVTSLPPSSLPPSLSLRCTLRPPRTPVVTA